MHDYELILLDLVHSARCWIAEFERQQFVSSQHVLQYRQFTLIETFTWNFEWTRNYFVLIPLVHISHIAYLRDEFSATQFSNNPPNRTSIFS